MRILISFITSLVFVLYCNNGFTVFLSVFQLLISTMYIISSSNNKYLLVKYYVFCLYALYAAEYMCGCV